jgi:hypothetical protein
MKLPALPFALCAVAAVAGCAPKADLEPSIEERARDPAALAAVAERRAEEEATVARLRAEIDEGYRKIGACMDAVKRLKIGTGEDAANALTCKHKVNRTETASGYRDQWVFHFADGLSYYLYFTNGVLVAKQT